MSQIQVKLSVLVATLLLPSLAFAWGHLGHRMVGEIAEQHLNSKAKKELKKILGKESLANSSTWADEIRSNTEKRIELAGRWATPKTAGEKDKNKMSRFVNTWHYTSVADKNQNYQEDSQAETGDIVYGMRKMIEVIKDKKQPAHYRRDAIRMLAHFIGDVHQPHHVGSGLDRGANFCWVNWFGDKYGKNISSKPAKKADYVNLHKVWDENLLNSREMSYREYVDRVLTPQPRLMSTNVTEVSRLDKLSPFQLSKEFENTKKDWMKAPLLAWVKESRMLRDQAYPGKPNKDGLYPYCFKSFRDVVDVKHIPVIGWDERYKMLRIAETRVLQAGVRLAATLNEILK